MVFVISVVSRNRFVIPTVSFMFIKNLYCLSVQSEKRLQKYVNDGMITKIPNFNAYFVNQEFKDRGITYPVSIAIIPTNEQ